MWSCIPMPTPEILSETSPQESQAEQPLSRDLWEPFRGGNSPMGWELIPWMGLIGWRRFFPKRQKKSKKKSKNNLTDCGSWLPIYFFFAILFFLLKMLLGHTWANSKKPCPSTWMANPPDILNGWTCGVYHIIYGRSGHHISTVHPWLHHPTRVITRSAWKEQNHMGAWTGP